MQDHGQGPAVPYWRDPKHGSMRRAAHWLATVIGEGGKFRYADLRAAIPDVGQVDRRARDLRDRGWVIQDYRGPKGLGSDEHQLVAIGDRIWEPQTLNRSTGALSARVRRQVFDRDGNQCVVCGIGAGEEDPDRPGVRARLTVGHLVPKARRGELDLRNLRTECSLCNEPSRHLTATPVDAALLKAKILELRRSDRVRLLDWARTGHRRFTDLEQLWAEYRQLPAPQRDEISQLLSELEADGSGS